MKYLIITIVVLSTFAFVEESEATPGKAREIATTLVRNGWDTLDRGTDRSELASELCELTRSVRSDCSYISMSQFVCLLDESKSKYQCRSSNTIGKALVELSNIHPNNFSDVGVLTALCMTSGRPKYECSFNRFSNASERDRAKAVCMSRGQAAYNCRHSTVESAERVSAVDITYRWDKFSEPNAYGNRWACRGVVTGQFADEDKCRSLPKNDNTWPN